MPTNNCAIEEQLMKCFVCDQQLQSDSINTVLKDNGIEKILSSHKVIKGSVRKQICSCNQSSYCPLGPITSGSAMLLDSKASFQPFLLSEALCFCLFFLICSSLLQNRPPVNLINQRVIRIKEARSRVGDVVQHCQRFPETSWSSK